MISPALTCWPPYRFTPSRWALLSRPFFVEAAPFLCAMTALALGLLGVDRGHFDLRVVLAVALTLAVARLVLVLEDVDLRALRGTEDLDLDSGLAELRGVGRDLVAVDDEHDGQGHALADRGLDQVDLDDVADSNLLLLAATAHDRVHRGLTLCVRTLLGTQGAAPS